MVLNVHRNRTAYQGRDRVLSRSKALYRYIATPKHFPGKLNMTPVYGDSVLSCLLVCVFISSLLFVRVDCVHRYERDVLLRIFSTMNCEYRPKRLCDPRKLSAEPLWLTSHTHRHTRRRGRCAGTLVKLRRRKLRPPLPCVFLSNVRSLKNKADELFFLVQSNGDFKDCSVFCFTETWLIHP